MGKIHTLTLVPFACMMIGAQDCVFDQIGKPVPLPAPKTSPSKPFCFTDPPRGCAAFCKDVDVLDFTSACSNVEAGPLTNKFAEDINAAFDNALALGNHLCTASNLGATFTPCMAGITPVEWPNQDHGVCTPVPPGCPL